MSISAKEVQLIKTSWKIFRAINPLTVGDVFYSKLFYEHPPLKALFKISTEEQSKKIIDMINVIVGRCDRWNELNNDLAEMAVRHVRYGVKPQHYKAVGDALLWTVQQGLGADWTPAVKAAWQACYTEIADSMIAAAYPNFTDNAKP